jgi:hypothetical protein
MYRDQFRVHDRRSAREVVAHCFIPSKRPSVPFFFPAVCAVCLRGLGIEMHPGNPNCCLRGWMRTCIRVCSHLGGGYYSSQ